MIWRYHYFWKHPHSPWFSMGNGVKRIPQKNPVIRAFTASKSRMFKPQGVSGTDSGAPSWDQGCLPKKEPNETTKQALDLNLWPPTSFFFFFSVWRFLKGPGLSKKTMGPKKGCWTAREMTRFRGLLNRSPGKLWSNLTDWRIFFINGLVVQKPPTVVFLVCVGPTKEMDTMFMQRQMGAGIFNCDGHAVPLRCIRSVMWLPMPHPWDEDVYLPTMRSIEIVDLYSKCRYLG